MTVEQSRNVPPHMLHLQSNAAAPPTVEFNDDAARVPEIVGKFSKPIVLGLRAMQARLRKTHKSHSFQPYSAKRASEGPQETQYLGEVKRRDHRWLPQG